MKKMHLLTSADLHRKLSTVQSLRKRAKIIRELQRRYDETTCLESEGGGFIIRRFDFALYFLRP